MPPASGSMMGQHDAEASGVRQALHRETVETRFPLDSAN
jgi:hypothetical protein